MYKPKFLRFCCGTYGEKTGDDCECREGVNKMKNWKPIENWDDIKVGDELQWEGSAGGSRIVEIVKITDTEIHYEHGGRDYRAAFDNRQLRLSRQIKQETDMIGRWVPVGADEIKIGDRLQVRTRVDKGDSDWEGIGIVESVGDLGIYASGEYYVFTNVFQRLAREDAYTDTDIYNMWNKKGVWQGAERLSNGLRIPGWTYKKVEKYPSVPVDDGVYRIMAKDGPGIWFLESKDGEWMDVDGFQPITKDFTIIQKYKEVSD